MTVLYKPSAVYVHIVKTENYVELSCDWTIPGLASFLSYNLVLVGLCSVFAFKTRKLPDNFNESRFISLCVYTTLIIWMAFVPTYFTANRQYLKTLLLSLSLIVNHTVAVIFLFLPKIYAAVHLIPTTSIGRAAHSSNNEDQNNPNYHNYHRDGITTFNTSNSTRLTMGVSGNLTVPGSGSVIASQTVGHAFQETQPHARNANGGSGSNLNTLTTINVRDIVPSDIPGSHA
ncbi:metabotropic glutamate receptor-like [Aplysia californica]|uniref:Metabotropic glutamate receptor-like n=1 Tax=Aplysia californica TaxID=6500 RepID=A0ABM1VX63_APLCA|nr:metabotropic glutamate receptor-like [Aplysia californica]